MLSRGKAGEKRVKFGIRYFGRNSGMLIISAALGYHLDDPKRAGKDSAKLKWRE